ncbi:two component transcriptional regulator, LuxR family [Opitutus terrae PB90-1]|uniref:Two component transcriptional regulator, LuxR family n=2 Tax=Opitutus terrae TaxID=107709 RepID=B1ZPH7_OPITP|nr:two component transcriptional regulator, LuxR family [Opitutus terrae PB90-1]
MSPTTSLRIVVLKWDRLYGDLIRRQIWDVWPNAVVQVFQRGLAALDAIQEATPNLFIAGVKIEDMDGLEHLEPFTQTELPILIVTSRADARTFKMLRHVRYDGIYDGSSEGLEHLAPALRQAMQHRLYVSPALLPFLQERRSTTLDALTEREQIVLSVIGDGSDNAQASERLGISAKTVGTHREAIMRKLGLHQIGQLMLYALQNGYVLVTAKGVFYPGFQRRFCHGKDSSALTGSRLS